MVIAEPETRVFADPFFALQLRGISKELTAHDNQLVLLLTEGRDDHARVGRYLAGGHVDGALVFSLHLDDPLPGLIQRRRCADRVRRPARLERRHAATPCTSTATTGAAPATAVRHLVGLGRTRIAHITGALDQTSAVDRLDGFRDVMADADPALVVRGRLHPGGRRTRDARTPGAVPGPGRGVRRQRPDRRSGALRVLRERGRRVPEDVAVVGFDDMLPVAEQTDPPLTTVRQDIEEMGRLMARLLLRGLRGPGREHEDGRADRRAVRCRPADHAGTTRLGVTAPPPDRPAA